MKHGFAILFTALCLQLYAAHAQVLPTRGQYIDGTLSYLKTKCAEIPAAIKDYERQGKPLHAEAMKDMQYTMCQCIRGHMQKVRATLSQSALNEKIPESKFGEIATPIVTQCGAEQFRQVYAPGCETRTITKNKTNPVQYCACMFRTLSQMPDADIMQISQDMMEYAPRSVEAKKRGVPEPAAPATVQRLQSTDASCSAG